MPPEFTAQLASPVISAVHPGVWASLPGCSHASSGLTGVTSNCYRHTNAFSENDISCLAASHRLAVTNPKDSQEAFDHPFRALAAENQTSQILSQQVSKI